MPTPVPLIQTLPGGLGTDEVDDVVVEELLGMVVDEVLVEIGALLVVDDKEVELVTGDIVLLDTGGEEVLLEVAEELGDGVAVITVVCRFVLSHKPNPNWLPV